MENGVKGANTVNDVLLRFPTPYALFGAPQSTTVEKTCLFEYASGNEMDSSALFLFIINPHCSNANGKVI